MFLYYHIRYYHRRIFFFVPNFIFSQLAKKPIDFAVSLNRKLLLHSSCRLKWRNYTLAYAHVLIMPVDY